MRLKALKERIFTKLFEEAEIAKFSQQELREYEDSLKAYRDIKNSIDTAKEEGREEGIAKEKLATAKRLLGIQKKIRIIIVCTIDEKGRVKNIKVMRGFAPEYDKEAIRVVKKLPKWKPGKMNGKAYKSKYCIPVVFGKEI